MPRQLPTELLGENLGAIVATEPPFDESRLDVHDPVFDALALISPPFHHAVEAGGTRRQHLYEQHGGFGRFISSWRTSRWRRHDGDVRLHDRMGVEHVVEWGGKHECPPGRIGVQRAQEKRQRNLMREYGTRAHEQLPVHTLEPLARLFGQILHLGRCPAALLQGWHSHSLLVVA